jgi:hypothetical protein
MMYPHKANSLIKPFNNVFHSLYNRVPFHILLFYLYRKKKKKKNNPYHRTFNSKNANKIKTKIIEKIH